MDLKSRAATILREKEEEKCRLARKTIQESLPNKSTTKMDLFQHDIFHNQKVHVGNVRRWSRHLVAAETGKPSEKKVRPTGHSDVVIHLPKVDSGKAEMEMKEETEKGQQELENAQQNMCTPPLQEDEAEQAEEHLQVLQNLHQTWQNIQTRELDQFDNIAVLAEEIMEEHKPKKSKSYLNWHNELFRTEMEGDQNRTSHRVPPTTRAVKEQQKRLELIHQDKLRKSVKTVLEAHLEAKRDMKALRLKEGERYEKWAAAHGLDTHQHQIKK